MEAPVSIFIGYSRSDEAKAQDLYDRLSAEGFRPWASIRDVAPEENLSAQVRAAIFDADIFLVCLSNNSVTERGNLRQDLSEQVGIHLKGARAKAFLVPVRLEECSIPESLNSLEFVDLFKAEGWSHLLKLIGSAIARRRHANKEWASLFPDLGAAEIMAAELASRSSFADDDDDNETLEGPSDPYSADAWGIDLRKLLGGHRELTLLHLGGVEEYVETHLEEAADTEMAEHAFHEALEKVVQRWQPSTLPDRINPSYLLDLIGAYSPPDAYVKVISLIQRLRQYGNARRQGDSISGGPDLLLKALVILEKYYIVAPLTPVGSSALNTAYADSYKAYIDILKEELSNPAHSGYVLKRLIEFGIVDIKSDAIRILIEKTPGILKELVNLLLDPNRQSEAENDLLRVLLICLNIGKEAVWEFEDAITLCDGDIEPSSKDVGKEDVWGFEDAIRLRAGGVKPTSKEERAILIKFSGREFHLRVSQDIRFKYQEFLSKRGDPKGFEKLKQFRNSATG